MIMNLCLKDSFWFRGYGKQESGGIFGQSNMNWSSVKLE